MKNSKFYNSIIKRFFGIVEPVDEFKRHEAERIGLQAYIILFCIFILISPFAILFGERRPTFTGKTLPNSCLCYYHASQLLCSL